jgi:hypothetical protein
MCVDHLRGITPLVALALATGCIHRGRPADAATIPAITVARVTNNNWLDVRVYGVRAGSRERIGIVRSFDTQVFELPEHLVQTRAIQLYVDAIGSRQSYQTDLIQVWPGQRIDLVVQQRLAQSYYSVSDP